MDERDPQTGDENERTVPDVESHRYEPSKTVPGRRVPAEGEEPSDETPDVEGHRLVSDKTVPSKTVPQ